MQLTREKLLAKEELKREKVVLAIIETSPAIVEDDVTVTEAVTEEEFVFVRQMSAREKNVWEMSQMKKSGVGKATKYDITLDDYRAKLAVVTVCGEDGELLFKPDDYQMLSVNISAAKLEKIVDVAQRLNAITEEDREEIVKN